jgi:hypothetical protein
MWKKGVAVALAAGLLVVGITLLRWVSSPTEAAIEPATTNVAANKIAERAPARITTSLPIEVSPANSDQAAGDSEPQPRGPSAGVWRVLGKSHPSAGEEREALIAAFKAAPPCIEKWCADGRNTLQAWLAAVEAKVPGVVTADRAECSAAGCWLRVTVNNPPKWRDVSAALAKVTSERTWPGPSVLGGPDQQAQRGVLISIWAILPNVDSETSIPGKGEE